MIRAWITYYWAEFLAWLDDHINHPIETLICLVFPDYALGYYICRAIQLHWIDTQDILGTDDMGGTYGWPVEEMVWSKSKR